MRAVTVAAALLIAGCGDNRRAVPSPDAAPPGACGEDTTVDDLALEVVAAGLSEPVWVGAPPGDPRLFIAERRGRIRIVRDGTLLDEPFLALPVHTEGAEQGLLGVAFPPDFVADPRFYVAYTESPTWTTVIAEYRPDPAAPDRAIADERRLLTIPQGHRYHNGGNLAFGPDGLLYFGAGEDGYPDLAQDPASHLGKLLRIDPADASVEVAAIGLRNPWRWSFDRATGDLYLGDVGQKLREEIDVVPFAQLDGANFGWPIREGTVCFNPDDVYDDDFGPCAVPSREIAPTVEYVHDTAVAVVGGHVYRGACMPGLAGTYVYSDNARNFLRTFRWIDGAVTDEVDLTAELAGDAPGFVTSFGEDAAGELYVVTYYLNSGPDGGAVSRIVPR
jgi:glucose/arabinose dehydrogenase